MKIPTEIENLIEELSTSSKYVGECPSCGESFRLKEANLFYLDELTPESAEAKKTRLEAIGGLEKQYNGLMQRIKKGAPKTSLAVNVGKVVEKVAPALSGFPYNINDCRFLAEPIDYLIFDGVTRKGRVQELIFMDIKTGKARLKDEQRLIKDAVEHNRVEQRLYEV